MIEFTRKIVWLTIKYMWIVTHSAAIQSLLQFSSFLSGRKLTFNWSEFINFNFAHKNISSKDAAVKLQSKVVSCMFCILLTFIEKDFTWIKFSPHCIVMSFIIYTLRSLATFLDAVLCLPLNGRALKFMITVVCGRDIECPSEAAVTLPWSLRHGQSNIGWTLSSRTEFLLVVFTTTEQRGEPSVAS